MKKFIIAVIFLFLFSNSAFAETSIKAEVDKTNITTDDVVTYKLLVDSDENNMPIPQIPKFDGFNVISQAQSSSISFTNSKFKNSFAYTYILSPKSTGKFKLEPSLIKIKDKTYSTIAFDITVTQGKIKLQPEPKNKLAPPKEIPADTEGSQVTI